AHQRDGAVDGLSGRRSRGGGLRALLGGLGGVGASPVDLGAAGGVRLGDGGADLGLGQVVGLGQVRGAVVGVADVDQALAQGQVHRVDVVLAPDLALVVLVVQLVQQDLVQVAAQVRRDRVGGRTLVHDGQRDARGPGGLGDAVERLL